MSDQESAKTTLFEGLFKNVVLRPFLRMVGSLFGQTSNQSSGVIDSMALVTISSSSSDDSILREIDNYRESPQRDTATSSATLVRQPLTVYGGQSGNLGALQSRNARDNYNSVYRGNNGSSYKRPLASNGGSANVMSGPATQFQARPSFSNNQGSLHSQTAQVNSLDDYNKDDDFGQSSKRAKRTLPLSFQTSMPSSGRPSYVDMSSSHSDYGRGRSLEVDIGTSNSRGNRVLPQTVGPGRSAPYINVSGPSRMLPASFTPGRSATSNANTSGPSHQMGDGEEDLRGTDERTLFQAALKDLSGTTGETDVPEGVLSVSLLAHQRIALAWMMEKEKGGGVCVGGILADDQGLGKTISMIALIQMQRLSQDKYKSEEVSTIKPEALNLDDDDDDDDDDDITIASTPAELKPKVELGVKKEIPRASSSKEKSSHMKPLAGTLVVCPASVLRQWVRELDEKVTDQSKLSVLMYHGSHRTKDPVELAKYDVVLTTYSIVSIEVPKQPLVDEEDNDHNLEDKIGLSPEFSFNKKLKKTPGNKKGRKGKNGTYSDASDGGALAKVRWFRIILDEAQTIKNHRTQVARACCSLRAKRRWCLSGTPIQNAIDELFSYFRFLRHEPFSNYKKFIVGIKLAISRDPNRGYKRLQLVLKALMLRRTKGTMLNGKPIITLPPKNIRLTRVEFSAEERAFYSKLEADSKTQFKAYAAAGTVNQNYANILLLLLRLRQACDHPLLVKGFNSDVTGRVPSKVAKSLPTKKLQSLIRQLETTLAICGVCQDPPENAVVTICGHVFCFQCVSDYLTGEDTTCPEAGCKEQVSADVIFTKSTLKNCLSDEFVNDQSSSSGKDEPSKALNTCSSKIKATIQILERYCKPSIPGSDMNELATWNGDSSSGYGCSGSQNYIPTKAIVFSQWTGMLDLVENALVGTGIVHRRLDGTMSLAARDKAVKDFNTRPEVTVMIMSLKAGNLGLNMVAACHVILLDLWWNPTTEDQAIDRAHRIGQTRTVTVTRLTVKDTVEDRILALQEEKRKMVASAFGEDASGGSSSRLTMEDLWNLFDVRRSDIPS